MKKTEQESLIEYTKEILKKTNQQEIPFTTTIFSIEEKTFFTIEFEAIDSTLSISDHWEINKIPSNTVICVKAYSQAKGKGQGTNTFSSPLGNIYLSFITKCKMDFNIALTKLSCSLATKDSLNQYLVETAENNPEAISSNEANFKLKWMNDVVHFNKKISGLLISSSSTGKTMKFVISVGVNLNKAPTVDQATCCLKDFTRAPVNIEEFYRIYMVNLNYRLTQLIDNKEEKEILEEINESLVMKNSEVVIVDTINQNKNLHTGILKGVNSQGGVLLETTENKEKKLVEVYMGRIVKKDSLSFRSIYNDCSCLSLFQDRRSRKFYYFLTASVLMLFARNFYHKFK
mmetsp:Transcript_27577/g.28714  ORF Transcript_27577/g.28714 Transcript_27577/m.28714 type:complete len:345 (-) Transcript_27577:47-1081(-)